MASFCSGLQRRRRSWPKSSPLLSLLLVINITVCLSLIVRGETVSCLSWGSFKQPIEMSRSQINEFRKLFPKNNRPIQQTNHREVVED
ncbi:hypothetical protein FGA82_22175 [Pseudomonas fluorescens]|nr:hypothetical protein FGA82_22175 [Pseudomonas fluorescens]